MLRVLLLKVANHRVGRLEKMANEEKDGKASIGLSMISYVSNRLHEYSGADLVVQLSMRGM